VLNIGGLTTHFNDDGSLMSRLILNDYYNLGVNTIQEAKHAHLGSLISRVRLLTLTIHCLNNVDIHLL
jgi:hypothetical protein